VVSIVAEGSVGFGIQLPIQAQSTIFVEEWEPSAGAAELAEIARVADESGFFYVAVCDHVAIPPERAEAMSATWWDTVATLSFLAGVTQRVRLLSHVYVLPYRHPLTAAKQWATLDAISGGRAILGVGAGHVEEEFAALGVDFATRGAVLDERIDAVRDALASDQRPAPVQQPLPIWVGGSSPAALRRAATRGDGWLPQGPPAQGMEGGIALIQETRKVAGRDDPIDLGALSGPLYVGDPTWDVGRCVKGAPEKIAGYLRTYRDMGVNHIQVRFRSRSLDEQLDQMRTFARDVAPLV
jgi:alkanesulfonate monooxygenase SsuD/methylene tetrahydromethanopterin reductase-like flavin-dependent oxidoreductase (luciferase family)